MTAGIAQVSTRIASLQARFGVTPGFSQALAAARGSATGVVGSSAAVAPTVASQVALDVAAQQSALRATSRSAASTDDGAWATRLPDAGRRWAADIEAAAGAEGVEPSLLAGLVWAESGFRADARSHAGALGLGQLMPGTADGLGVDPHDPRQNLRGAARYLRIQLDRFGREDHALAAYNAGPGRVQQYDGIPPFAETQAYVPRVLGYRDRLEGRA